MLRVRRNTGGHTRRLVVECPVDVLERKVFLGGTYMMVHFGPDGDKDYLTTTPPSRV